MESNPCSESYSVKLVLEIVSEITSPGRTEGAAQGTCPAGAGLAATRVS